MTISELRDALHALGFVSAYDEFEDGEARLIVAKLAGMPGHRLLGEPTEWTMSDSSRLRTVWVDEPAPQIDVFPSHVSFTVNCAIPSSPGAYTKQFLNLEDVLEEILHYFFDPDSRMRLERRFAPGSGRPNRVR